MVRCSEIEESGDGIIIIIAKRASASIPQLSSRMDGDPYDDDCQSDSGVSADFSTGSIFESPVAMANMDMVKTPAYETPIEREIRRAVQREQSLRRARGIKNVSLTTEYVEIPLKKSVLCPSLPVKSETSQGKDRQFAGKKMQQEIHAEVQREQALVKLGTVPGVYDKGTVRELKERKQLFEAFHESRVSSGNPTLRTRAPSWAPWSPLENQENVSTPVSPSGGLSMRRGQSIDLPNQKQQQEQQQQQHSPTSPIQTKPGGSTSSTSPRGPGFSEGSGCQVIILESNLPSLSLCPPKPVEQKHRPASLTQTQRVDVVDSGVTPDAPRPLGRADCRERTKGEEQQVEDEDAEEELVPKENPFFKLRPSLSVEKVEQDIREAQERERELRRQRTSLYGAAGAAGRERGARGGRGMNRGGGQRSPSTVAPPSFSPPARRAQPVSPTHRVTGPPAGQYCG